MAQLYDQLRITKIQTSVYHPEANGLVERFNGTLEADAQKVCLRAGEKLGQVPPVSAICIQRGPVRINWIFSF